MRCVECEEKECYQGEDCTDIRAKVMESYGGSKDDLAIARIATFLEGEYYMKLTRLEELVRFAEGMGYEKLGIAFCIGLSNEAKALAEVLERNFVVSSVCCKVCGIEKDNFGLEKIDPSREEAMCNPIGQAAILNRESTDLNIICGLCIGHDVIFSKHSEAPVTTLIVKDRVLAHNPAGALYSGYYRKRLATNERETAVREHGG